jgi:hypothetical protein
MSTPAKQRDAYRAQLARWARALAMGREEEVYGGLAEGSTPEQVRLFVEGNGDKRQNVLRKQLAFLAESFDDLDELLLSYAQERPLAADDTGTNDGERFLRWLEKTRKLTPERRDYVACQRARHAVENEARRNRRGHLRFQELWSLADSLVAELETNPGLRLHLNPIRVGSRFATRVLLNPQTSPPVDVLFFAVRRNISTAVLNRRAKALVEKLAQHSPCTLAEWAWRSAAPDREELAGLCRDLAMMGLVAFS